MSGALSMGTLFYTGAFGLIVLGLYGVVMRRHLARVLLALGLLEAGVNLLVVAVGFRPRAGAPIALDGRFPAHMVDPVPQALILTSIVIGVGVTALGLALAARLWGQWGTLDTRELAARLHGASAPAADNEVPAEARQEGGA